MRRLMAMILIFGTAANPALCQDDVASYVEKQAAACWSVPRVDRGITAQATFAVKFAEGGEVADIEVLKFTPEGPVGEAVARSASRAIQRCGPYTSATGTLEVTLTYSEEVVIDPFKKSTTN